MLANPSGTPVNQTASGTVAKTGGRLLGFYVNGCSTTIGGTLNVTLFYAPA